MSPESEIDNRAFENELLVLLRECVLDCGPAFHPESDLFEHGLDSLALMQLLMLIEQRYRVILPDSELTYRNLSSVRHLARLIGQLRRKDEAMERKDERL